METGWLMWNSRWYYLNQDGVMIRNAWVWDNEKWYYLGSDGAMLENIWTPDGYYVGIDGAQ